MNFTKLYMCQFLIGLWKVMVWTKAYYVYVANKEKYFPKYKFVYDNI